MTHVSQWRVTAVEHASSGTVAVTPLMTHDWLAVRMAARYRPYCENQFDDLLQECRVALIRAVEKFDFTRGSSFEAYASRILHRAARKYLYGELRRGLGGRSSRAALTLPRFAECDVAEQYEVGIHHERRVVWDQTRWQRVLRCLSDKQREVVMLRLFNNKTNREVGQHLGFRESRASRLWLDALDRLRQNRHVIDEV